MPIKKLSAAILIITASLHIDVSARGDTNHITTPKKVSIAEDDKRVRKTTQSPKYLNAVLKIVISFKHKKKAKFCTGTLIGSDLNRDSRVVLTAAHCGVMENGVEKIEVYATTAQQVFKMTATAPDKVSHQYVMSYEYDWAIIVLDKAIEHTLIKPILIFNEQEEVYFGETSEELVYEFEGEVTVAGYSTDAEIGDSGKYMTYETFTTDFLFESDIDYYLSEVGGGRFDMIRSFTYPGASGGPVIAYVDVHENGIKKPYIASIIKGGMDSDVKNYHSSSNGVKGSLRTKVVDMKHFKEAALEAIKKYNN